VESSINARGAKSNEGKNMLVSTGMKLQLPPPAGPHFCWEASFWNVILVEMLMSQLPLFHQINLKEPNGTSTYKVVIFIKSYNKCLVFWNINPQTQRL
jgi:hypothetical protein